MDRPLYKFFLLSIFLHSLIFINFSHANIITPKKKIKKLEVTYLDLKEDLLLLEKSLANLKRTAKIENVLPEKKFKNQKINRESLENKKLAKLPNLDASVDKPQLKAQESRYLKDVALKVKKINIPQLEENEELTPGFKNYYQLVRNKIKQVAYKKFIGYDEGVIYVSFIIGANGNLKNLKIIEEESARSSYLIKVALQSIKQASPYPKFPKEIRLPELSFRVPISFEIK